MGHISGASSKVKDYRIRRHNAIVNCVAEYKGEGLTVCLEPKIVDFQSEVWKPDLIFIKNTRRSSQPQCSMGIRQNTTTCKPGVILQVRPHRKML